MTRTFWIIFIFIFAVSCSQKQTDNKITEFENVLGKRKTKAMNMLVSDFEKNLDKIYPNLSIEKGYRQYLTDLISNSTTDWKKFNFQSDKTNIEFHNSGLYDEIYIRNSVHGLEVNTIGKYMQALYKIKDSDSLIDLYWKKREAAGILNNNLFINGILYSKPDFNNYFHKRIVVIEFSF